MLVKFFATYRDITKSTSYQCPAPPDVLSLLTLLAAHYGAAMRAKLFDEEVIVLVNGRHIQHLAGLATPLTESDVVSIFPLVAGG